MTIPRGNALLAVAGGLCALALAFGAGYRLAVKLCHGEAAQERAARYEAVARQVLDQTRIVERLEREIAAKRERVRTVTRTLIEEVPVYVTEIGSAGCVLPVGFIRLHNLAAAGEPALPDSAAESHDATSGVALDYAAAAIVENYGTCRELRDQVIDWQRWYTESRAQWEQGREAMQ